MGVRLLQNPGRAQDAEAKRKAPPGCLEAVLQMGLELGEGSLGEKPCRCFLQLLQTSPSEEPPHSPESSLSLLSMPFVN